MLLKERRIEMAWPEKGKIRRGVASMLEVNLAVQDGEKVIVMTDPPRSDQWREMGLDGLQAALERCVLARMVADLAAELMPDTTVTYLPYPAVARHGAEPDAATVEAMRACDVIIAITNYSLTHTIAAQEACDAGARIASMPGFLAQMFEGPMAVDYQRIADDSKRMALLLSESQQALITTPVGTELALSLEERSGDVDTGLVAPGRVENLPAGEAFIAPLEGKAKGKIVVTPKGYPGLEEEMTIHFTAGEVCEIQGGGHVGDDFRLLLELPEAGRQAARRNLAELGIGTNAKARSVDSVLEAEKIMGTVHIAIGDNAHMGGVIDADLHEDFVLWEPDLSLDGKLVIRRGEWLV
jgi:leucyl aminopeptidase (aminopeptidase T)